VVTVGGTQTAEPVRPDSGLARRPRRIPVVVIAVIGLALVVMPFAFTMFTKAPQGASMLAEFRPFMTASQLDGFQTDFKDVNAGVQQTHAGAAAYLNANGTQGTFAATYPSFVDFYAQWPSIDATMTNLLNKVQGSLGDYQAMAALPSFTLFPWFFVIPGALFLGIAAASLRRPRLWRAGRWVLVVLGLGLVAAPVAFQMFQRAPDGGHMMSEFKTIETTANVQKIQGYFGTMAEGQGAIRLEVVPGLEKAGLSKGQLDRTFPAIATLDTHWVHILNEMTPMIGAMSDNVGSYHALASLPPFPLFPWFFVGPGVLIAGCALLAGGRNIRHDPVRQSTEPPLVAVPEFEGAV
jgi:hypothetical protein